MIDEFKSGDTLWLHGVPSEYRRGDVACVYVRPIPYESTMHYVRSCATGETVPASDSMLSMREVTQ